MMITDFLSIAVLMTRNIVDFEPFQFLAPDFSNYPGFTGCFLVPRTSTNVVPYGFHLAAATYQLMYSITVALNWSFTIFLDLIWNYWCLLPDFEIEFCHQMNALVRRLVHTVLVHCKLIQSLALVSIQVDVLSHLNLRISVSRYWMLDSLF